MNDAVTRQVDAPIHNCIKVFVLLAHGFGGDRWNQSRAKGATTGIEDDSPYGYGLAEDDTCIVRFSSDRTENGLGRFLRLCLRRTLGFDAIHAWYNREQLCSADAVWTHTELEHLAVLLIWRFKQPKQRPKLIAQSVWMYDRWWELSSLKRWLFRRLLDKADLLTVLSTENLKVARELFPRKHVEFIPFGINSKQVVPASRRKANRPLHVLALGRDMHRDWNTLIAALGSWSEVVIKIAAPRINRRLLRADNVTLEAPVHGLAIRELYQWADIVLVPLKPNLHASGITVLAEAALFGVPTICSDTGGLRAYFSDEQVCYVPTGDVLGLRKAVFELASDDERRFSLAVKAQQRVLSGELNSRAYALRHRALTQQLIADDVTRRSIKIFAHANGPVRQRTT